MRSKRWMVGSLALALVAPAWGALAEDVPAPQPLVVAQAEADPEVEGRIGVERDAGEEGVEADVRFEFGKEESSTPPVSAAPDDAGSEVLWVGLGIGALVIILIVALLSRNRITVVRD